MSQTQPRLRIEPLDIGLGLRKQACDAIKRAIMDMDIYGRSGEIRLDERQLSEDLGVSRTPIREALSVLEQEGFVRSIPRRGIIVVRKTKREIVEMITVWAAIESMAARLAATARDTGRYRRTDRADGRVRGRPDRASDGILRRQHGIPPGDHPAGRHRADVQPDRHRCSSTCARCAR